MIVVRFPPFAHFKLRALEWFISGILVTVGVTLLNDYPTFSQPMFANMAKIADEGVWGAAALIVGTLRLLALYINGAWHQTPWIRMITAILSSLFWVQLALCLINQPVVNLELGIYMWFIGADWYSIWRAANDAHDNRKKNHLPLVA